MFVCIWLIWYRESSRRNDRSGRIFFLSEARSETNNINNMKETNWTGIDRCRPNERFGEKDLHLERQRFFVIYVAVQRLAIVFERRMKYLEFDYRCYEIWLDRGCVERIKSKMYVEATSVYVYSEEYKWQWNIVDNNLNWCNFYFDVREFHFFKDAFENHVADEKARILFFEKIVKIQMSVKICFSTMILKK